MSLLAFWIIFWVFRPYSQPVPPHQKKDEFFYDAIVFWVVQNVHKTLSEVTASISSIFVAVLKSPL